MLASLAALQNTFRLTMLPRTLRAWWRLWSPCASQRGNINPPQFWALSKPSLLVLDPSEPNTNTRSNTQACPNLIKVFVGMSEIGLGGAASSNEADKVRRCCTFPQRHLEPSRGSFLRPPKLNIFACTTDQWGQEIQAYSALDIRHSPKGSSPSDDGPRHTQPDKLPSSLASSLPPHPPF